MDAVVDTTVLIALSRLDHLGLLPQLYERVLAPEAVRAEALAAPEHDDVEGIRAAFAAGTVSITTRPEPLIPEVAALGAGEAATIVTARALGAVAVLDDRGGRLVARALGVRVTGTVGVLIQARRLRIVPTVMPLVRMLDAGGFHIGPQEYAAAEAADSLP